MQVRGFSPATPCWAQLTCPDPSTAAPFYQQVFDWQSTLAEDGSTVFTLRDLAVAGMVPGGDQPAAWLPYVSTEDLAGTTEAVGLAGGQVLQPPTVLGSRGQAAVFADGEGAVFGAWQRGTFRGARVVSEPNAVCWNELATRDMAGAVAFYGKTFSWSDQASSIDTGIEYREWQVGNRVVAGMLPMEGNFPDEIPAHWRVTIEVDVCAATAERCTAAGGQVLVGPLDVRVGQYAQLLDPVGGMVGIIELLPELRLTP